MSKNTLTAGFQNKSNTALMKSLQKAKESAEWKKYCMYAPSASASETYEWLKNSEGMQEFKDERKRGGLEKYKFTITNVEFEKTLSFRNRTLERNPGVIKAAIPGMIGAARKHVMQRFVEVMVANGTCFDAENMFATAHPSYKAGTTYSNLLAGTGTATVANIKTDWDLAMNVFYGQQESNGHPLFEASDLKFDVFHSVAMRNKMAQVFDWQFVSSGSGEENMYRNAANHYTNTFLTGNSWYILATGAVQKPFIFQEEVPIYPEWDTTGKFKHGETLWGLYGSYEVGNGHPQLALKVNY